MHGLDTLETAAQTRAAGNGGAAGRALAAVNRLVVIASSVALVAASLVLTYSVIVRHFLHFATDWQDEMSVFLIIGAVFLSSAAVQAQRGHIGIEAIAGLISERANRIRQILVDAASFVFCAYFAWKAWLLLDEAIAEGYHSGSTWGPPLWIPYSVMTAGMGLLSLQLLLQIATGLRRKGAT